METARQPYSLGQLSAYAFRLGTIGFGGPVALVGYMHRDLVEQKKWISESEFKEGMTLAQLMPGPLAAQLAIYLGFVHHGVLGATAVGTAFVLPSFVMVVALGWAYVHFGGIGWMQAVFYGVGASVIGIITISAYKLTLKTIGNNRLLWGIFLASAAVTIITESESIWFFLGAGILFWAIRTTAIRKATSTTGAFEPSLLLATAPIAKVSLNELLTQIAIFFAKAGAFVFGSGLAIVPFLYGGVGDFWSGFAGASVAALATFLPCYLLTILPAPYFKKHGKRPGIVAFVDGVTGAAVGAIAGACVVLGRRTIFENGYTPDVPKVIILLATVGLLLKFKKLPEPVIVLAAAIIGLIIFPYVKP
ncbi:MAG: chromate efflux transporter [Pirellula sp.]|nr:chromate efflux transporter [Pirellula sp.]